MVVKTLSFLLPIGIQKGGIQIQQKKLWLAQRVHTLAHQPGDPAELFEGGFVHAAEKSGNGRLRSKGILPKGSSQNRVVGQFIRAVIRKVAAENLENHLQQVLAVRMETVCRGICGLEFAGNELVKPQLAEELPEQQTPRIGGQFSAIKIYFQPPIAF